MLTIENSPVTFDLIYDVAMQCEGLELGEGGQFINLRDVINIIGMKIENF